MVEAARAAGRLGDRRDHGRRRARADARRRRARRDRRARQQGMPGLRRRPRSCGGRRRRARPCCRSIPSTTRSSRRSARVGARTCGASSSPPPAVRSATGRSRRSATRPSSRRSSTPTGRWVRRSPSTSATMMNKGLEIIEAHHLFGLAADQIDVLVHPQSIVHGMVEFRDGSMVAQLGPPDMRVPIAHCLAWPAPDRGRNRLRLDQMASLTFAEPDLVRFPAAAACVRGAARRRGRADGAQRRERNRGRGISRRSAPLLRHRGVGRGDPGSERNAAACCSEPADIDDALAIDHDARRLARDLLPEIAAKAI